MTTLHPTGIASTMQTYFSKRLLEVQVDNLRLAQFGLKAPLPPRSNTKTVRWFKPAGADTALKGAPVSAASVAALTEGVPVTSYREINYTYVEAALAQYGEAAKISDVLDLVSAYEPLKQVVATFGLDAALSADTLCRQALVGPGGLTHNRNNDLGCERFAGVDWSPQTSTSAQCFDALRALAAPSARMSRATLLGCVTRLAANKAPAIGGRYIALISPEVHHDLVQDSDYLRAFQGAGFKGPFNGAIGTVDGVEFVEATNPHRESAEFGTYDPAGNILTSLVLGAGAFGVPQLAGGASPYKPAVTILRDADKSDPLNQFILAGWKVFYAAKGLDPLNVVAVRSKTTFA